MARGAWILYEMWRDEDFRALSRTAQCTYVQLCSDSDLSCAGIIRVNVLWWSKACSELDVSDIQHDLEELESRRFVFVDHETHELFVRARMRSGKVAKTRTVLTAALRSAASVLSKKIRGEVAAELRRLRHPEADDLAAQMEDESRGIESVSIPYRYPTDRPSTPTPTPYSLREGGVGGTKRPVCKKHVDNHDGPCGACARRREWDEQHQAQLKETEIGKRRTLKEIRRSCPHCDENGMMEMTDGTVVRCPEHREAAL